MKKITILLLLAFLSTSVYAQHYRHRHTKGIFASEANFGITKNGKSVELGFIDFISSHKQQLGHLGYEWGKVGTTDYSLVTASYYKQYSFYEINQQFYLNIFFGALIGYEKIDNDLIDKSSEKFTPGLGLGLEIESYISNQIAILVKFQENYRFNSNLGDWSYKIQIGCRYFF